MGKVQLEGDRRFSDQYKPPKRAKCDTMSAGEWVSREVWERMAFEAHI